MITAVSPIARAITAILCAATVALAAAGPAGAMPLPGTTSKPAQKPETHAAGAEATPPKGMTSPNQTMETFFTAMRAYDRNGSRAELARAAGCLDVSGALAFNDGGRRIAQRLFWVLHDVGVTAPWRYQGSDFDAGSAFYSTGITGTDGQTLTIGFVKGPDGAWRVGTPTLEEMDALYRERNPGIIVELTEDLGLGVLVQEGILGLRYYQWVGLFLVLLTGVAIDFIVRVIVTIAAARRLHRHPPAGDDDRVVDTKLARRAAAPFGYAAGGIAVYVLLPLLNLPTPAENVLRVAAQAFALAAGIWAAYRVVDVVAEYFVRRAAGTESRIDDLLIPLVRKAAKIFIAAFGLLFIAESFDLPVGSLIAGLGIGGLAIAFAAKDTIENLFGSVAVILDRPFVVGDWVVVEDVEGIVEELGFRSTRIRTFYNSLVTVPNATLVRAKVDNYSRRTYRRFKTTLTVTYDTPPDRLDAFCDGIRDIIRKSPNTRKDVIEVHMNDFGASSLNILLYMFFRVPTWSDELTARHALCLDIIRLADDLGVSFAFPTRTIHMVEDDLAPAGHPGPGPGPGPA